MRDDEPDGAHAPIARAQAKASPIALSLDRQSRWLRDHLVSAGRFRAQTRDAGTDLAGLTKGRNGPCADFPVR
jgi:hypothetical protein